MMAFDAEASKHVGFGDRAHAGVQDLEPHLLVGELGQQVAEHFHRALHVALENDVQFLGAGGLDLLRQAFERDAGTLGQRGFARLLLAVFGNAARLVAIGHDHELIARLRQTFHAQNFDRRGGRRVLQSARRDRRTWRAPCRRRCRPQSCRPRCSVPFCTSTVATGPRPRSSLASSTTPVAWRSGVALSSCRSATRQIISISRLRLVFCFAETSTKTVLPPQSSGIRPRSAKLLLHAIRQGVRLIDLVDRHDDRHFGRVGVVDGFKRLRHDAVIGRHHQHDNVGGLGAARTHAGEGFVAGRIEEHDLAAEGGRFLVGNPNFVGADMLRDAAGFASGDIGQADGVEQRGFAVIDVAHDGDHRRPGHGSHRGIPLLPQPQRRPCLSPPALRR